MTLTARLLRFFLRGVVNSLYRIEVIGAENVPATGRCLVASNHLSYADPLIFSAACPRIIRFLAWRELFKVKVFAWFSHHMRSIPISDDDSRRQLVTSLHTGSLALQNGECLGLFGEGSISRLAQLLGFQRGMEHLVKAAHAPIIPVHLDGVWGSILSYEGGLFFKKWPKLRRLPITVSFGKPLPVGARARQVREVVLELGSVAFGRRLNHRASLRWEFVGTALKNWFRPCIKDGARTFTYGAVAIRTLVQKLPDNPPILTTLNRLIKENNAGLRLSVTGLQEIYALKPTDVVLRNAALAGALEFGPGLLWPLLAGATLEIGGGELDQNTLLVKDRFALTTNPTSADLNVPTFRVYARPDLPGIGIANTPTIHKGSSSQIGSKIDSVGRPVPGVATKIENGFLIIRGPMTGWIDTKQPASMDEQGFVTLM